MTNEQAEQLIAILKAIQGHLANKDDCPAIIQELVRTGLALVRTDVAKLT